MNKRKHVSGHAPVASAVQQLLRYPQLPLVIEEIQAALQAEREKRARFYQEMSEERRVEFIMRRIWSSKSFLHPQRPMTGALNSEIMPRTAWSSTGSWTPMNT
jgi:hypothetical protein